MILLLFAALIAFFSTYMTVPFVIRKLKARGIVGIDVHKLTKPVCAEMGGISILFGIILGYTVSLLFSTDIGSNGLPIFLTVFFTGLVGILDDFICLRQRYKPFLVGLSSVPLLIVGAGQYLELSIPYVGNIFLSSFSLLLIPLAVATASNLTNMLAGFNGLEAGISIISCFSLGIACFINGNLESASLAFIIAAAYLAFLRFNWYPAKIFPGDTGTLMTGAAIAAISIFGNVEIAGLFMLVPAGIDFTLKMVSRLPFAQRKLYGDSNVENDGSLVPPLYPALPHVFMRAARFKEKEVVLALLFMQSLYSAFGIFLTLN